MLSLRRLLPRANSPRPAGDAEMMPLAVLEFQSPTAAIIATPTPFMARYTNYFVSGLMGSLILIACLKPIDRLVVTSGDTVSGAPDFSIQAFNATSIVKSVNVHTGELVTKGQVLATLDPTYAGADLTALTQQQQLYSAEVAQLQAQEDGTPYVPDPGNPQSVLQEQTYNQQTGQYNFTMQNYAQQAKQLETEIAGFNGQAADYGTRLAYAQSVLAMRLKLEKLQVGSHLDVLAAEDALTTIQTELSSALSSASADEKQLASVQAQGAAFEQQWKAQISTQLATAIDNLAQAQQSLTKAKLNDQLVALTAPQDAIVQSVAGVAVGSVLQAGQQVMDLAPVNAPLSIETDIDSVDSGFVHVGDPVTVKFATLPFLEFGMAKGTVTSISQESINPLDQQATAINGALLPGGPQDLFYKAEISLDVINLHNVPPGFRLVPGMPVEADMKVGKRTVMAFFLQKMLPIAYNSFHMP